MACGGPENGASAAIAASSVSWRDPPTAQTDPVQERAARLFAYCGGSSSCRVAITYRAMLRVTSRANVGHRILSAAGGIRGSSDDRARQTRQRQGSQKVTAIEVLHGSIVCREQRMPSFSWPLSMSRS